MIGIVVPQQLMSQNAQNVIPLKSEHLLEALKDTANASLVGLMMEVMNSALDVIIVGLNDNL